MWMQYVRTFSALLFLCIPGSQTFDVQAQMEFKRTLERRQLREMQILMPEAFLL